ncbi:hypothetical protein NVS55_37585 [Myxococcus stipitatus]|uniref:hypothetical protein n=1 Tax=Myxococcus stipitatus TaxID=83455 RepID=UPI003144F44C
MNRLLSVMVMCMSMGASASGPMRPAAQEPAAQGAAAPEAGGLTWTAPSEWAAQGARPMRAATYKLPAAKGDAEPGELAVFYFGPGQGGAVDANVKRWLGQFQTADGKPVDGVAKTKTEKLNGMPVTTVDVKGTYLGGGPMMGPSTPKPGYRLLGAIVEGSEGAIFFKLTGPEKTVAASEKAFRKMLESVKKK